MQVGGDDVMLCVVEGKLARITQDVSTLRMERIPMAMQEHVVGVPSTWLHLLRRVNREVLCYRDDVEATTANEGEDQP